MAELPKREEAHPMWMPSLSSDTLYTLAKKLEAGQPPAQMPIERSTGTTLCQQEVAALEEEGVVSADPVL